MEPLIVQCDSFDQALELRKYLLRNSPAPLKACENSVSLLIGNRVQIESQDHFSAAYYMAYCKGWLDGQKELA